MRYFVVYDQGNGPQVFPTEDYDSALQFAAHQKVSGAKMVRVAETLPGELVLTAQLVPVGKAKATKPARKAAKFSRPKGAKRTPEEIDKIRSQVLSWVQTNPGHNIEDLGKALDIDTKELVLPIRKLLADKVVRKRGRARATKYFPASEMAPRKRKRKAKTEAAQPES